MGLDATVLIVNGTPSLAAALAVAISPSGWNMPGIGDELVRGAGILKGRRKRALP